MILEILITTLATKVNNERKNTFDTLNLNPNILKAIAEKGYLEPTQIQSKSIPKILKGFDIKGSAQTGTGKTGAFLLPILSKLSTASAAKSKGPRALILAPTRELAMQIETEAREYSKYMRKMHTVCVVGGVPYPAQMRKLARPYEILIATPGRLIDYIHRGKINFSKLEFLVLDEADRMLDMGFLEPVEEIASKTPSSRQTLMFSATMQGSVAKLAERLLNKPMEIVARSKRVSNDHIKQTLHYVNDIKHKNQLLDHILGLENVDSTIIFTSTKRYAGQLVEDLMTKGHLAAALHGDMNQRQRTRTIEKVRRGKVNILVATDVAARGIDVQGISHVINFDMPMSAEDYVHRIGRTGRAGETGTALSFAAYKDGEMVKKIEKFTGHKIDIEEIEGLKPNIKPRSSKPKKRPFKKSFSGKKRFSNSSVQRKK